MILYLRYSPTLMFCHLSFLRVEGVVPEVELARVVEEVLPREDDGVVLAGEEHRLDRGREIFRQGASLPVQLPCGQLVYHTLREG